MLEVIMWIGLGLVVGLVIGFLVLSYVLDSIYRW